MSKMTSIPIGIKLDESWYFKQTNKQKNSEAQLPYH